MYNVRPPRAPTNMQYTSALRACRAAVSTFIDYQLALRNARPMGPIHARRETKRCSNMTARHIRLPRALAPSRFLPGQLALSSRRRSKVVGQRRKILWPHAARHTRLPRVLALHARPAGSDLSPFCFLAPAVASRKRSTSSVKKGGSLSSTSYTTMATGLSMWITCASRQRACCERLVGGRRRRGPNRMARWPPLFCAAAPSWRRHLPWSGSSGWR